MSNHKTYRLTLIRFWKSLMLFFLPIFLPVALMVLGIRLNLLQPGAGLTLATGLGLMFALGGFLLLRWRRLLPRYEQTVILNEDYIEIAGTGRRISWSDIRWYREDTNSPIVDAFVLGVRGRWLPLSWKVIKAGNNASAERAAWEALRDTVRERLQERESGTGNYYDRPVWSVIVLLMLLSNPILWVWLYSAGIPLEARLIGSLAMWLGVTVSFAGTVWYNRRL